jgi:hypothetical protein
MAKAPVDIRSLARSHTELAINTLSGIALNGKNEGARVAASVHLLDRGWGRAATTHTGEDGSGPIAFVIRHILEQRAAGAPNGTVTIEGSRDQENVLAGPWTRPDDDQGGQ